MAWSLDPGRELELGDGRWIQELVRERPRVTVVIPCRQEEGHIGRCLEAVLDQDVDASYEVLVVDGMSTDRTRTIVEGIASRDPRVRLLDNPAGIVPPAMNIGIRAATGDIIVRVDGHCRIPRDYLREVLRAFEETGAECVGGSMVAEGETYAGKIIARATSTAFGMGGRRFHGRGEPRFMDTVYLGAYPKRTLLELGLYDERFVRNQDDELNYRLRERGGRVYFTPRIWAAYTTRPTLGKLLSQYAQYGFWKVRVYRKHPRLLHLRHLIPAGFLLALIGSTVLTLAGVAGWVLPVGILVAYFTAGVLSSLLEGVPAKELPGLLLAYPVIHLSYGAGFLLALAAAPSRSSIPSRPEGEWKHEGRLRRFADVVVSAGSLVLLFPVFLLVAVAIKLDSPGPVLFRQERIGKEGTPFRMLKFRSMVTGADRLGPRISGTRDPRITRVGNILRATKLDELPQLWNVLRGEMTLIGPRAEVPEMIDHYTPEERRILAFKPGLTGPGQLHFTTEQAEALDEVESVETHYVEHQLHPKLAMDLEYLQTRGWTNDLEILWRTVKLVLLPQRLTRQR